MKILLLIAFVVVGSSQIFARPGPRWWDDDSDEHLEDYDPNMDNGGTDDDASVEKSIKDYDGFEKYWSKPIKQLYDESDDSTHVIDPSSKEMPWHEGKEVGLKPGTDDKDDFVFKDKDAIPKEEILKSLHAGDLKVVVKEEASSENEQEDGTDIEDNSDGDKEDSQNESDEKDVMSSDHKDFTKDYEHILSPVDRQPYNHPRVVKSYGPSNWYEGEKFLFTADDDEEVEEDKLENNEENEDNEEAKNDEQDTENKQDEKDERHKEDGEDKEGDNNKETNRGTKNEENVRSSGMDATHLYVNKDLPDNFNKLFAEFNISPSGSKFLLHEHQANIQDFLAIQNHINDALKELNTQNEMTIEKIFLTAHERSDYNGQLHRDFERQMTEMIQVVDQIKGRIIQMQQIEKKHNYQMLLNALLLELNGKSV